MLQNILNKAFGENVGQSYLCHIANHFVPALQLHNAPYPLCER